MQARWRTHATLIIFGLVLFLLAGFAAPEQTIADYISISTAWWCLILMAAALLTGPAVYLRSGRKPVNLYLRRDIGIWAAIAGLIHFFVATDLSMSQSYLALYVNIPDGEFSVEWLNRFFSWGSTGGFVAGILLLVLLAISNDKALSKIGQKVWKRVQMLAYPAFLLTALHGLAFQLLESRVDYLIWLLGFIFAAVVLAKLALAARRTG